MTRSSTAPNSSIEPGEWLRSEFVLPALLSVLTHASLITVCVLTLRGGTRPPVGFSDEPMREIGIVIKEPGDRPDAQVAGKANDVAPNDSRSPAPTTTDTLAPSKVVPDEAPAQTTLPQLESSSVIGPGANLASGAATVTDPRDPVRSNGSSRPAATGTTGGPQGTSFMGVRDVGTKVVFVIDASGSMTESNAIQVAKASLISSLQALDEKQHFLIIFYDELPRPLKLKDEQKPQFVQATEINKTLARQKIAGVQPDRGTSHLPPLEMALRLRPDVVYFLTDALEPPLYPPDLQKVKNLCAGKCHIHAIQFGQGPEYPEPLDKNNFLRHLAKANGGTYRYLDVTKFKPTTSR